MSTRKPKGVREQREAGARGRKRGTSKTSGKSAAAAELAAEAWELRVAGATIRQIADQLGRGRSTIHDALVRELEALKAETLDEASRWRTTNAARLERMLLAAWPVATRNPPDLEAQKQVRANIQELNKMFGVHAPIALSGADGQPLQPAVIYLPANGRGDDA